MRGSDPWALPPASAPFGQTAGRGGERVVDTVPWLCTATVCPPVISGTVAYFDNSHLANAYALKLTIELTARLATVMPRDKPPH
jgi:hypothetical protein